MADIEKPCTKKLSPSHYHDRRHELRDPDYRLIHRGVCIRLARTWNALHVCNQQQGLSDDYGNHHAVVHDTAYWKLPGRHAIRIVRSEDQAGK